MAAPLKPEASDECERQAWLLRTQGWTQQRIADHLKISQSTVHEMLRRRGRELAAEFKERAEEIKAEQTELLQHVAEEALTQWRRSYEDAQKETTVTGRVKATELGGVIHLPDQITTTVEGQSGNPGLLQQAMKALAEIRLIWGLDAPQKREDTITGELKWLAHPEKAEDI